MKNLTTCVHFNGVQNPCGVGVDMAALRDTSTRPFRWPCLAAFGAKVEDLPHCEKRRYPTAEEVAEDEAEWAAAFQAITEGRSPCCDAPLAKRVSPRTTVSHCPKCGEFVSRACRRIGEP